MKWAEDYIHVILCLSQGEEVFETTECILINLLLCH